MSKYIKFNMNNYIRVKLNHDGRAHLTLNRSYEPLPDEDGYYEFQMWDFVGLFGDVTHLGMNNYYETNVLIEVES